MSVLTDAAIGSALDRLSFRRYVDPLVEVIADPDTQTPLTIGIFGQWGSGKSSLLQMVEERLAAGDNQGRFLLVRFNPWFYRGEPNLLLPLLHTVREELIKDSREAVKDAAKRIGTIVARLGANMLLKSITSDGVSLKDIDELEQKYQEQRGQIASELSRVHQTLQEQADKIARAGARIVLFVDDLDRCEPDEIIDLLESIKLFLDLQHVIVLLAVDKEVIDRGINIKYQKFNFEVDRQVVIGAEYLEKIVQLPLYLYPLASSQVRDFISTFVPEMPPEQVALLNSLLMPNPRKIKRILNILAMTRRILAASPSLEDIEIDLLIRLTVMQVQYGDLYAHVVGQPDLLVALEETYSGKRDVQKQAAYQDFKSRAATIRGLVEKYYRPDTNLSALFADAGFTDVKPRLSAYLTLLGG